jgi:hypothetical protein
MKTDSTEPVDKSRDSPHQSDGGLVNTLACGMLFLALPSFAAISLALILADRGVSPLTIEKGMVWLSVPWFAICYALCRTAHGITLVVRTDNESKTSRSNPEV